MDPHELTPRQAGWTMERRVRFLRLLAEHGDVRRACAQVGLSRQSVYKLRRRDPAFARVWRAAVEKAREARIRRLVAQFGARPGPPDSRKSESNTRFAIFAKCSG